MHLHQGQEGQRIKIASKHENLKGQEGSSLDTFEKLWPVDTLISDI